MFLVENENTLVHTNEHSVSAVKTLDAPIRILSEPKRGLVVIESAKQYFIANPARVIQFADKAIEVYREKNGTLRIHGRSKLHFAQNEGNLEADIKVISFDYPRRISHSNSSVYIYLWYENEIIRLYSDKMQILSAKTIEPIDYPVASLFKHSKEYIITSKQAFVNGKEVLLPFKGSINRSIGSGKLFIVSECKTKICLDFLGENQKVLRLPEPVSINIDAHAFLYKEKWHALADMEKVLA